MKYGEILHNHFLEQIIGNTMCESKADDGFQWQKFACVFIQEQHLNILEWLFAT